MAIGLHTHLLPRRPGETLNQEYIKPQGLQPASVAHRLGINDDHLKELLKAQSGITPDTAHRLERLLGQNAEPSLNVQRIWDLWHEMHEGDEESRGKTVPVKVA